MPKTDPDRALSTRLAEISELVAERIEVAHIETVIDALAHIIRGRAIDAPPEAILATLVYRLEMIAEVSAAKLGIDLQAMKGGPGV